MTPSDESDRDDLARRQFGESAAAAIGNVDAELMTGIEETGRALARFIRLAAEKGLTHDQIAGMFGGMTATILIETLERGS